MQPGSKSSRQPVRPARRGAVAERVKRLLLDGVPAEDIVIATRSLDEDGLDLPVTLTEAGIDVCCETATRFSQTAIGRALFAVLQSELQDWEFGPLCAVLRSNYFRPRWPFAGIESVVETTIRVLRRYQLGSDRQHILKRLAKLAEAPESPRSNPTRQEEIRIAARLLQTLSDATRRLRSVKDLKAWADSLMGLAGELGIEPRKKDRPTEDASESHKLDNRDRHVWDALCEVLREAARVRELLNDRRTISVAEFARLLRDLFESQTIVESPTERDRVRVVEAADVRNLDVPHLFLMGLSEASFPRGRRDDCFYSAAERRDFLRKDRAGLEPPTPQQDEMLLFYSIVTRARQRLTLSYPSVSASGQPLFPSPYVTAIRDLFYRPALVPAGQSDLDPVPSRNQVLSMADLRLAATDELHFGRLGLFRALAAIPSGGAPARGILAAAEMDACRFEQNGFTPFEGWLQHGPSIARLAEKYSPDYQFSATQLERYATCPYRFLLSDVLDLEPHDPVEPEIDPRKRGLALHQVLADLHRSPKGQPLSQPDRTALIAALRELVAGQFAVASEIPAYERALQAAELEFAERFADLYCQQCEDYRAAIGDGWEEPPSPRFVELAFGNVPGAGESTPEPAALPCVTFGPDDSPVRVRGRIDRIDVGRRGGKQVFTVIDYKTRWAPRYQLADIELGLALQLAIYASAARRSGVLDPEASVFQMAYWTLTLSGCVVGLRGKSKSLDMLNPEVAGEIERALHEVLPKIAERLRRTVSRDQRQPRVRQMVPIQHRLPRGAGSQSRSRASETVEPVTAMTARRTSTAGKRAGAAKFAPHSRSLFAEQLALSGDSLLTDEQRSAIYNQDVSIGLSAGAGCGKTHVLTRRFLTHLEPSGNGHTSAAAPLARVVAITFTDRAAREMRDRIREECAKKLRDCEEGEISHWLTVVRGLDAARISTIHAFCSGLLRRHAVAAGIDPQFRPLEMDVGEALLRQSVARTVKRLLEAGDPNCFRLLSEFGLEPLRRALRKLVLGRAVADTHRFQNHTASQFAEEWRDYLDHVFLPRAAHDLGESDVTAQILRLLKDNVPSNPTMQDRRRKLLSGLTALRDTRTPDVQQVFELREAAKVQGGGGKSAWADEETYEAVKKSLERFRDKVDGLKEFVTFEPRDIEQAAQVSAALVSVVEAAVADFSAAKVEAGVLDFDDLLVKTRDLLRNSPDVHREAAASIDALLVDEYQDTDRIQSEIVEALVGDGLLSGKLFFVGDSKQSIYRFRGAEPSVFDATRERLPAGGRLPLTHNFRSQPEILSFVNSLFRPVMEGYEALVPHRTQLSPRPSVEFLFAFPGPDEAAQSDPNSLEEHRRREAEWIARRILTLLSDPTPRISERDPESHVEHLRRVKAGDIAVLFRAMSDAAIYEDVFRRRGVDYYLVGGRAFFAQQEVYDLVNLCTFLNDPADSIALVGVLRSPFFSLSDDTIVAMTQVGKLSPREALRQSPPSGISETQCEQVRLAARVIDELLERKDRVPLADLLELALERTAYDASLLCEFLGRRKSPISAN